jgi:nucleotide-binding universal stress UspA family protein
MFLLLGLGEGKKVHIVTVQRGQNEADEIAMQALRMCAAHNVNALAHGVATSQDPGKAILAKTQELSAGLVVMGAFSHSTISEVLFGSCTHTLMKKSHVPLFIYH